MSNKKSNGDSYGKGRTRSWTFIVYPESVVSNWRDILDGLHIQWVESPLHDKDVNADGQPKKAHIHILVLFESVKTYEQVKEITDVLKCTIPQKCAGAKALVRYMAHLDNPDKAQYNISDIIGHGGVDIADFFRPSSSERYQLLKDMIEYIRNNNIVEYQDLVDYAMCEHFDDWFPLLADNSTFFISNYIKSARHRSESHNIIIDKKTGEIL